MLKGVMESPGCQIYQVRWLGGNFLRPAVLNFKGRLRVYNHKDIDLFDMIGRLVQRLNRNLRFHLVHRGKYLRIRAFKRGDSFKGNPEFEALLEVLDEAEF